MSDPKISEAQQNKNTFRISDKDLMENNLVKKYLGRINGLDATISNIAINLVPKGLTEAQYFNVIMQLDRNNEERFSKALERNDIDYPKGLSLSKYSSKESEKKEKLSIGALNAFAKAKFENAEKLAFINEAVANNIYTELDAKELMYNRDNPLIIFKPGSDPQTKAENKKTADYMLCKDVNKDKCTEEEFLDIKSRRFAEVFNKRMEELVNVDYSKFDNLSDEELVKNWVEFARAFDVISVIKAESAKYMNGKNKYFNDELAKKCNEIEKIYGNKYMRENSRLKAMASPYYSKYDIKGFEKISPSEIRTICYKVNGNPALADMLSELSTLHSTNREIFMESIVNDLNKKGYGVTLSNVSVFDSKGNPIKDDEAIFMAAKKGAVFAAPKDRPDLLKPYVYNPSAQDAKDVDPKPYEKVMTKIRSTMPDITRQWAEEEELLMGGIYKSFINDMRSFNECVEYMAVEITKSENPDSMKEVMYSSIKRIVAPYRPMLNYDEYANAIGLKQSEKFSSVTVEERRQLTERALIARFEYQLNKAKYSPNSERLIKDTSVRQFTTFFLKSSDTKETNDAIIEGFFGGSPEIKKEMILKRVSEYKETVDRLYGRDFSDKDLIDNFNDIFSASTGMGMEFVDPILNNYKKWGINFSDKELEMMKQVNERAYALNNLLKTRIDMMGTAYYQYGGFDKLAFGENTAKYSNITTDPQFHKSYTVALPNILTQRMEKGTYLLKAANPDESLSLDFIYDGKGNYIRSDSLEDLGDKAFESGRAYVFYKGQKDPVVIDCKNPNKVPPEFSKVKEITPVMQENIRSMRIDHAIIAIDQRKDISQEMKNLEKDIINRGYELGVMADSLGQSPQTRDTLKRKMSEYLASLTVRQMLKNASGKVDEDSMKALASNESIKALSKDLRKSPLVDLVLDDMLKKPEGLKNIDSETVYNVMLGKMGQVRKIMEDQKQLKILEAEKSIETVSENKKAFIIDDAANNPNLFGLTQELLTAVSSTTNISFSIDRASIQTQAVAIMLEQGLSVDKILEDTPEAQKQREFAAKQAIAEVVGGKNVDIRNHLVIGSEKLNEYIISKMHNMKDFSATEMAKPENRNLRRISPLIKDFFQELNTVNNALPENQRKTEEELDRVTTVNDMGNKLITSIMIGMQEPLNRMINSGKDFNPCEGIREAFKNHLSYLAASAASKAALELPENKGKELADVWNGNIMAAARQGYITLATSEEYDALMDKCEENRTLANKVYRSLLDDSARKLLNVKVTYNENGEYNISMDMKNFAKVVNEKVSVDIPQSLSKLEKDKQKEAVQNVQVKE